MVNQRDQSYRFGIPMVALPHGQWGKDPTLGPTFGGHDFHGFSEKGHVSSGTWGTEKGPLFLVM